MAQPARGAWLRACGIPALSKGTLAGFQEADYSTPTHKPICKHWFFQRVLWAPFCALLLATAGPSAFAAYPDKPIRLIVPFPAGGAGDFMARGMAQRLAAELGQQVIIDNRGGAGGSTAAEAVAKAPADGYTLLFGTMGTQAINAALYPKLRYDPLKDFAPIALTHITLRVLVVHAAWRRKM